jgi:hypothetical protein
MRLHGAEDLRLHLPCEEPIFAICLQVTMAVGGDAWLGFMGNEFGHPEWIDFPRCAALVAVPAAACPPTRCHAAAINHMLPRKMLWDSGMPSPSREGNGWSHEYARRQWSLADSGHLRYGDLLAFEVWSAQHPGSGFACAAHSATVLASVGSSSAAVSEIPAGCIGDTFVPCTYLQAALHTADDEYAFLTSAHQIAHADDERQVSQALLNTAVEFAGCTELALQRSKARFHRARLASRPIQGLSCCGDHMRRFQLRRSLWQSVDRYCGSSTSAPPRTTRASRHA